MARKLGTNRNDILIGTLAADQLFGFAGNDTLTGLAGIDTLDGGLGNDTMRGGLGNDIYIVDAMGDKAIEFASQGTDLVKSSATFTLGLNVENLTLTTAKALNGIGNTLANKIIGNGAINMLRGVGGIDTLEGLGGNDSLDGGTGADTMKGGLGNDTYVVDAIGDRAIELGGQGTDLVRSSVSFTLGLNLENLILGGAGAIDGTGNTLANTIIGNAASNILTGGLGNDTLHGGLGSDTISFAGAGAFTFTLGAGGNGTATVQGTDIYTSIENVQGGAGVDLIIGNAGVNILSGGAGDDAFDGGGGNDTVHGGDGIDGLSYYNSLSSVTFTLPQSGNGTIDTGLGIVTFTSIENISGSNFDNDTLTGNDGANVFFGHRFDDTLDGGDGNDTLNGGDQNDTLLVGTDAGGGDIDALNGEDGSDTISFINAGAGPFGGLTFTFALAASGNGTFNTPGGFGIASVSYTGIENVTGRNNAGFGDVLSGNDAGNVLNGLDGADTLDGGDGADTLNGGGGDDTLLVGSDTGFTETDVLNGDFGSDTISFVNAGAGPFGGGTFTFALAASGNGTFNTPGGFGIASVSYTGIENVTGRNNAGFGDVLSGNADNNVINGLAGNDTLDGGGGHDTLNGGDGNDVITGGVGNDILDGGNNDDSFFFVGAISFAAASGFDTIHNFVLASGDVINLQDLSATGSWSVAEIGADSLFSFFDADVNVFANTAQVLVTGVTGLVQGTDFNII